MTTTTASFSERRILQVMAPGRGVLSAWGRMIGYGVLSWVIVFAAAMAMYPWRLHNRPLFESCIAVVLAATTGVLGAVYFGRAAGFCARHGLLLGIVWAATNVLVDLAAFSAGPMKMAPGEYFADIATTYLMIPVITTILAAQRHAGAASAVRPASSQPQPSSWTAGSQGARPTFGP